MIVASAIKIKDGRVFVGKRHGDCFYNMLSILNMDAANVTEVDSLLTDNTTGFITDKLEFLGREDAYYEAFKHGQCKEQIRPAKDWLKKCVVSGLNAPWKPCLASEDLW